MLFGSVLFACKQEIDLYEGESSIYFDDNYGEEIVFPNGMKLTIKYSDSLFPEFAGEVKKHQSDLIIFTLSKDGEVITELTELRYWMRLYV